MKTYYKYRMTNAAADCYFGLTGYEIRGEGSRLRTKYADARTWKISSTKPENFECGDADMFVILKARARSIGEARALPENKWERSKA